MKIGVLAVQGAFAEHIAMLTQLGVDAVPVRLPTDLEGVSGLIIPGGESTTMRKLIDRWGLHQPILDLATQGRADLWHVRRHDPALEGDHRRRLARLSAAGHLRQAQRLWPAARKLRGGAPVPVLGDRPVHAVFIRAPIVERVGDDVDVLAELDDGRVVAVRKGNVLATAFHPELAGETRFHRLVATMAAEYAEPGEGSGRRHHPVRTSHRVITRSRPNAQRSGRVRAARLTDLAALGELSRQSHMAPRRRRADADAWTARRHRARSACSRLFRLPLGAFHAAPTCSSSTRNAAACAAWPVSSTRACATSGPSSSSTRSTRACPATSAIGSSSDC